MPEDMPKQDTAEALKHGEPITLTSEVVAAYVGNNATSTGDSLELVGSVYDALSSLGVPSEPDVEQEPAVPIKRSVKKDSINCLESGKAQKMLKRHLAAAHDLTPEKYRAKWRLPYDYPMVAPDYAEKRRTLAKKIGLGQKPATKAPAKKTAKAPARRNTSRPMKS